LRDKYREAGQLDGQKETMLWTLEIKRLIADIKYAEGQVTLLIKVLKELQKNSATTANDLDAVLE